MESALSRIINKPVPTRTQTYSPVPHLQVIENTIQRLEEHDLRVEDQWYLLGNDANQLIGRFSIAPRDEDSPYRREITFRNSYDKSMSLSYGASINVRVCSNGIIISVGMGFRRKHTGSIQEDLNGMIDKVCGRLEEDCRNTALEMESMKSIETGEDMSAKIVGDLFVYKQLLTTPQLNVVSQQLREPSYDYGTGGNTLFDLYNHCSHSYKMNKPINHFQKSVMLHQYFKGFLNQN